MIATGSTSRALYDAEAIKADIAINGNPHSGGGLYSKVDFPVN